MRSTGLSVKPVAGSEIAAAKLSIPICIYVTYPRQTFIRLIGVLRRYAKVGLRPWIDSGPEVVGAVPNLFQYCFQGSQFFRALIGKDFPDFGCVLAKNRRDQFFAF